MRKSPITKGNGPEIIRLLDVCFKHGVLDSCDIEDDYAVKEWYDGHFHTGFYGIINLPDLEMDWKRWRFQLVRWCRESRLSTLAFDYIDAIRTTRCGFQYLIIPVTYWFYLLGVKEWLAYPNDLRIEIFRSTKRIHWDPSVPKSGCVLKNDDYINIVQECIYDIKDHPMAEMANKITPKMYEDFEMALWVATRPRG